MLPVVVVDFDANASGEQAVAVLDACNQALGTTECVAGEADDPRPTRAIAVVNWLGPGRVRIEVGTKDPERWLDHELEFEPEEPENAQWQTVGFTIATLVGEERAARDGGADERVEEHDTGPPPSEWRGGVRLGPRVAVGMDRPTILVGGALDVWSSPSALWTPVVSVGYALPARPSVDVRWRELELRLGALLRHAVLDVELRAGAAATVTRVAVSDGEDAQSAWVPGVRVSGELHWPRARSFAWATRVDGQLNDGSTAVFQGGRRLGASPAWLVGISSGLELRF